MAKPVLFIADLHLDPSRADIVQTFGRFLEREAPHAEAIYILGDLFEAWIGDDAVSGDEPTIQLLNRAATCTPVYIMHGNRDFLLGERFCQLTGTHLLDEPSIVDIHGHRALILHGDSLCTEDHEYQDFRAMVRDPRWQQEFLALSIEQRLAKAREARDRSKSRNSELTEEIMDVSPQAVDEIMAKYDVQWLIHGHTHRPNIHRFDATAGPGARFVVGDWYEQGSVLRCTEQKWELETLALETG
ncbi:UDP-2,3-diacylglucosamine diphosphatase [Halorhodospira halochloris]|uniref:UDP-2,3-diacylglucosamine diphosphatase n=1 Tax=Halorhodospira halochloris TaxID=1052 RepID=UPI001EE95CD6|nr:UDP-2,3-diacylglucosamine diphosphatase [Halorhodospira halochloris]MCG5548613.1 UDP-2,3-diacylglucosamine diphosphatase [Halorhodospira halochloris]